MTNLHRRLPSTKMAALAALACFSAGTAQAFKLETSTDWDVNIDNSIQYTTGWRAQNRDPRVANHLFFAQGDAKFDKGDMVTNRVQDLIELQAVYKKDFGFRVSASVWKDWAYDDQAKQNPAFGPFSAVNAYPSGRYSDYTKRYYMNGGEWLDGFVFANTEIGGKPVYAKAGRLTQYWGNAFFFGFSNIAYGQSPIDYIKAFSQPGSEVKELFLPRKQILLSTELTPELSVTGQYFFEFRPNRYPDSGTYLGFFDVLYQGPPGTGFLGLPANDGMVKPKDNNQNFGIKVSWAPKWAGGDMGFYYRQTDETDPWTLINPTTFHLQNTFAEKVKLIGFSYERSFGLVSTGFEINQRRGTALNTPLVVANQGAKGNITNVIANTLVQLGKTPIWDAGILLAELSYTHLDKVTANANLYNGVGNAVCTLDLTPGVPGSGTWRDGCSTKNSLALAFLFTPQWLQVMPGIDIETPMSYTVGVHGNPAYRAARFYAEGTNIYSVGIKATFQSKHSLALQYNGYHWRTNNTADNGLGLGLPAYAGFGGNGATGINDRGWVQLTFKTSF